MKKSASGLCVSACLALAGGGLLVSSAPAQAIEAAPVAQPAFDVLEFVIEGNTVLPAEQVEQAVQPYLGPAKTFKDIEAARAALEKAYQDAGFLSVVVSLPNQRVDQGEVRFEVTEAQVSQLKVTGAQYNLPSRLAAAVPSLAPGAVPYFPQVQDELAAAQRSDLQITPLIGAGKQPDQLAVELKVDDKPAASGSIELNSRQSFNSSRGRLEALASYNNLFQRGHNVGLSWQYAPYRPKDANTLTLLYGFPLTRSDSVSLSLTNSSSDTPTGTSLGGATLTRGQFFSGRVRHQLDALRWPVSHSLSYGLDYKNNQDRSSTDSGLTTEKPALRYPVLNLGYELNWQGNSGSSLGLRSSLAASSRDLNSRQVDCEGVQTDQFDCKRAGARADFLVWKFGADVRREVLAGWRVTGKVDAQLASGPLASGEQFSLGGTDTVRGYYDYEQAGDQGWTTRVELGSPEWLKASGWSGSGLVFVDRGFVLIKQALAGQIARVNLGSYGLGLRLGNAAGTEAAVDVAMPVFETSRAASSGGLEAATRKRPRLEVRVKQAF
jgi:hemolysin activation/secretion protein